MTYKTELHCHSRDASGCASESAEGIAKKYAEAGYSTVCLTNHFNPYTAGESAETWMTEIEKHYLAYDNLVKAADGRFTVLMGLEFRLRNSFNDYLVFGFSRTWLESAREKIDPMSPETFYPTVRENGFFMIHAHPFRFGMLTTRPEFVDAIEVHNGHPGHNSNNDMAELWAKKYGKIMTSGTDHHDPWHLPNGGILTEKPLTSERELVDVLREGRFELIR